MIARQRVIDRRDRLLALAWHVAAFSRQEKLPDLKRILSTSDHRQTPAEQLGVLQVLSARYGIPLKRTRLIPRG